jgi:SsrA-binding protein
MPINLLEELNSALSDSLCSNMNDNKQNNNTKLISSNKKAGRNYQIIDTIEVGVQLRGTEVKSLYMHESSLDDAYVIFKQGSPYLINCHISPYKHGNITNHEPMRNRKLLMHKHQILKWEHEIKKFGYSLIPLRFYWNRGKIKLLICTAKGLKYHDKRDQEKRRDMDRERNNW